MKKILYAIPFFIAFLFSSCGPDDEDNVFGESAANRMDRILQEYKNVLTSAPNGWKMSYYAGDPDIRTMGEYTILVSFDKEMTAVMATESSIKNLQVAEQATSYYSLIADQGPVLSFDTYNPVLHYFTEPSKVVGYNGYKGDFDFVIREVTKDKIVLEGRKYHQEIILTPMDAALTWDTYLVGLNKVIEEANKFAVYNYQLLNKGKKIGNVKYNPTFREFILDDNVVNTMFSATGFGFSDPVDIEGTQALNFTWMPLTETFECLENKDIVIKRFFRAYEYFLGNYTLFVNELDENGNQVGFDVSLVEKSKNRNYSLKGLPFDIVVKYSEAESFISISPQFLGQYKGDNMMLWLMDTKQGYITQSYRVAIVGVEIDDKTIRFEDNGIWNGATADGFHWRLEKANAGVLNFNGPITLVRR